MVLISLVSVSNLLYFHISTSRSMCAVPNMAVFCSSLTSCFPGMLLTYFPNEFEIVPVAPIITGIIFVLHSSALYYLYYYYLFIIFIQGIYNDIPETNHVSEVHSVAAVKYVQFVLHVMLIRL